MSYWSHQTWYDQILFYEEKDVIKYKNISDINIKIYSNFISTNFFLRWVFENRHSKILFPFKLLQITIITIDKYTCNYTRVLEKDLGFNGATLFPTWNRRLAVNLVSESSILLNEVARGEKLSFDSREQKYTRGKVNGKKLLPRLRR